MSAQASVELTLRSYSGRSIEIWVDADETGAHAMLVRGAHPAFAYWNYVLLASVIFVVYLVYTTWRYREEMREKSEFLRFFSPDIGELVREPKPRGRKIKKREP
jgi:hypothetical protein